MDIRIELRPRLILGCSQGSGAEPLASPESVLKRWVSEANPAP